MFTLDAVMTAKINKVLAQCLASVHIPDTDEARLDLLTAMRILAEETFFDGSEAEVKYLIHLNVMIADLEIKKQFHQ